MPALACSALSAGALMLGGCQTVQTTQSGAVGVDRQQPHGKDELYVVIAGTGTFVHAGKSTPFQPGDTLFVRAGVPHRFEDFSADFATWVFFWGPEGGE